MKFNSSDSHDPIAVTTTTSSTTSSSSSGENNKKKVDYDEVYSNTVADAEGTLPSTIKQSQQLHEYIKQDLSAAPSA